MIIAHMTEKEKYFRKNIRKTNRSLTILVQKEAVSLEKQDWNLEQQVWQRVKACREEVPQNDLRQLQREAMELAAIYRSLSSQLAGRKREIIAKLHAGEQANAAALTGIGTLLRQNGEQVKLWQPGREDPGKQLERCYHRTRRCMMEYLARSADSEFGVVFEKLAKREGEHCGMLAELIGSW